jgi:hypothetical protein
MRRSGGRSRRSIGRRAPRSSALSTRWLRGASAASSQIRDCQVSGSAPIPGTVHAWITSTIAVCTREPGRSLSRCDDKRANSRHRRRCVGWGSFMWCLKKNPRCCRPHCRPLPPTRS